MPEYITQMTDTIFDSDSKVLSEAVGKRLMDIRNEHDMSQGQLARTCGLTQNIISRMENGNSTYDNFLVVCNFWLTKDYNLNYLLAENNSNFYEKNLPEHKKENIAIYYDRSE